MPNLALYLLGYEVKKPVSSTNLQDPGQTTAVAVGMLVFVAVYDFYRIKYLLRSGLDG